MNKRVSPTVIGAFVVASFAILVVALIVVGSGKMFTRPVRFICMFQGNLNGLKVGAPVKVRGVQIGTVAAIELRLLPSQGQITPGHQRIFACRSSSISTGRNCWRRGGSGEALETSGFDDLDQAGDARSTRYGKSPDRTSVYRSRSSSQRADEILRWSRSGPYREIPTVQTDLAQLQERLTQRTG